MKGEHGIKENLSHTLINIGLGGGLGTLLPAGKGRDDADCYDLRDFYCFT